MKDKKRVAGVAGASELRSAWARGEDHPHGARLFRRHDRHHHNDPDIVCEYDNKQNVLHIFVPAFAELTEAQQEAVYRRTDTVWKE